MSAPGKPLARNAYRRRKCRDALGPIRQLRAQSVSPFLPPYFHIDPTTDVFSDACSSGYFPTRYPTLPKLLSAPNHVGRSF